jgi:hypothetical protein
MKMRKIYFYFIDEDAMPMGGLEYWIEETFECRANLPIVFGCNEEDADGEIVIDDEGNIVDVVI